MWPFKNKEPPPDHRSWVSGQSGFGAPLHIAYVARQLPGSTDNNGLNAYVTQLLPRDTPIGTGIPNKRDVGTAPPVWSKQGVGLTRVGDPGILAGSFVSGPLTNITSGASGLPIAGPGSYDLPGLP